MKFSRRTEDNTWGPSRCFCFIYKFPELVICYSFPSSTGLRLSSFSLFSLFWTSGENVIIFFLVKQVQISKEIRKEEVGWSSNPLLYTNAYPEIKKVQS